MQATTITCDVCGEVKKETNHWFGVDSTLGDGSQLPPAFHLEPWVTSCSYGNDVCGRECLGKLINEWMDNLAVKPL